MVGQHARTCRCPLLSSCCTSSTARLFWKKPTSNSDRLLNSFSNSTSVLVATSAHTAGQRGHSARQCCRYSVLTSPGYQAHYPPHKEAANAHSLLPHTLSSADRQKRVWVGGRPRTQGDSKSPRTLGGRKRPPHKEVVNVDSHHTQGGSKRTDGAHTAARQDPGKQPFIKQRLHHALQTKKRRGRDKGEVGVSLSRMRDGQRRAKRCAC